MKNSNRYIIWGAGEFGKSVINFLGAACVDAIIDLNEHMWGKKIKEIEIYSIEEGLEKFINDIIIICVPEKYICSVEEELKRINRIYISRNELKDYVKGECKNSCINNLLAITNWEKDESSDVEFYLVDSFEITHFLPLYRECINVGLKAKIVCEAPIINANSFGFDYDEAIKRLNLENIEFSTLCNPDSKVAITTQFASCLSKYKNKKIGMTYGVALLKDKAFQLHEEVIQEFDYMFVHGSYQKNIMKKYLPEEQIIDISYPRYANTISYTKESLIKKYNLDSKKKTLVYMPTWDEHSSISRYAKLISDLKLQYNIVVKPHHCTTKLLRKRNDYEILKESFETILDSKGDIREALILGDIYICDAKSAVGTEVAFLNRKSPIILIYEKCTPDEFWFPLDKYYDGIFSIEDFQNKIEKFDLNNNPYLETRNNWIEQLYSSDIKEGITRAVNKLKELCNN